MISKLESEKITLQQKQLLSLTEKIEYSLIKINQFYEKLDGRVYISFSGGKDSTVLLHLVHSIYPKVPVVFVNTGLEYPEIVEFVKTIPNVTTIRPKMNFKQVLDTYGYPVISKMVSMQIRVLQNPTEKNIATQKLFREGIKTGQKSINNGTQNTKTKCFKLANKWRFLEFAPFKISEQCCNVMKKNPFHEYEKETGLKPFVGTMASDSRQRKINYFQTTCNSFGKRSMSRPLSIWLETDIWEYLKKNNLPYSKIYNTGMKRTGCMFCMFGIHLEKNNRFDIMKEIHPQLYKYCMENLGLQDILNFINKGLESNKKTFDNKL